MRQLKLSGPLKIGDIFQWNDAWKIERIMYDSIVFLQGSSIDNGKVPLHKPDLERTKTLDLSGCYFQVTNPTPAESAALLYNMWNDQPVRGNDAILLRFNYLTQPRPKAIITSRQKAEQLKAQHARKQRIAQSGLTIVR